MPAIEVTRSLAGVREALERKGFSDLYVTHYDNTPVSHVVLHDDHGRLARGDVDRIERGIEAAADVDGLWSALDQAGMTSRPMARQS
jgi:hypothetical protein